MRKRIYEARIISNREIADGIYRLILDSSAADETETLCDGESSVAKPGQFFNLYLGDKSMLLPRPISVCLAEKNRITLIYRVAGNGTGALSLYKEGDFIKISTPLGQGYHMEAMFEALQQNPSGSKTIALVAGGLGVPPMLELAKTIRDHIGTDGRFGLIAILGFREKTFLTEELSGFCDEIYIATESGAEGFRGNVLELIESKRITADYTLSCGPKPMLKALTDFCARQGKPLQVSLEERMGCGYGACVGCTCRTGEMKDGNLKATQKKVCKDGPVFFGEEVIWDE